MIDRCQFLIAKAPYQYDGWRWIKMKSGRFLSYEEELEITVNAEKSVFLLGGGWQTDPQRMSPQNMIFELRENTSIDEIYKMEETWCGRYVLIVGNWLFLDAAGLLGIFYGNGCISSSLHVLCDFCGVKMRYPKIAYCVEMNYMPGELTCYREFRRLLPSQILNIETATYEVRPLLPNGIRYFESDVERTETFVKYFCESLKNMRRTVKGKFMLALTGGVDSRTLASLLEYAGIDYECFTLQVKHSPSDEGRIPSEIAQTLGKKHQYILCKRRNFSYQKWKEYLRHAAGMAMDGDIYNYSHNQYNQLLDADHEQIVILRSNLWEIVEQFYRTKFSGISISEQNMRKVFKRTAYDHVMDTSLREWLEYVHNDTQNQEIHDIDRFYWEIRDGGWLASIEQACDVMDGMKFFQPCNARVFHSILFGYEENDRMFTNRNHQKAIIEYACPQISNIPYNANFRKGKMQILVKWLNAVGRKSFYYCKWYGWKGIKGIFKEFYTKMVLFLFG